MAEGAAGRRDDVPAWEELSRSQARAVSWGQIVALAGNPLDARRLLRARRWQILVPGVYATFSGPVPLETWWWAFLLHAGPGAALGGEAALWCAGIRDRAPDIVDIVVPHERRVRAVPGAHVTRCRALEERVHPARRPPQLRVEDLPAGGGPAATPGPYPGRVDFEEGDLERVIAVRVREQRLAASLTVSELATRVGLSKAMLSKIENAQTSCSLTTLGRVARGLDVPVTALFRGVDAAPEASFVAAGQGARIVRRGTRVGHDYLQLGSLRGAHKRLEALHVTLTESSEVFPLFQHDGTEFIYVLEGAMVYGHGEAAYEMRAGDSLMFDGQGPHGPSALLELPVKFLAITGFGAVSES